jgi:hypothetical protein
MATGSQPPTSWSVIYQRRLHRAARYSEVDAKRNIGLLIATLGPPSIGAGLAGWVAISRFGGAVLSTFFEQLLQPAGEATFTFDQEGLYIIRCRAIPSTDEGAEVVRPPSVAWLPVFARDPAFMAESRLALAEQQRVDDLALLTAVRQQMQTTPTQKLWDKEAELVARLGTVSQALEYQEQVLKRRLDTLVGTDPPGFPSIEQTDVRAALERLRLTHEAERIRFRGRQRWVTGAWY